ncbi:MAG: hypothetical protein AMXMBFR82_03790 [Candidatus Hydrogenedentota bacterium]
MKGQTTIYTEVEPFEDDFNDGNYTGWSAWSGTWSAANMVGVFRYHAQPRDSWRRGRFRCAATAGMTPGAAATIAKANTDNDLELRFSYVCNDTSDSQYYLTVSPRYASSGDRIYLLIKPGVVNLNQRVGGVWSSLDAQVLTSTQGVEYTIRVVCDGQSVQVYRTAPGALEEEILSTSSCTVASTNYISFTPSANADFSIDNVRILSDDLSTATTFAVNNANELTSMTDYNGSTTFGFDAWGRMTSKARGSYAAAYGYKYGQMLCSVASNWPGEGGVTYDYGGNLQRRERIVDSTTVRYNWDGGFGLVSEEDDSGNLTRTYTGRLADVNGSTPATGTSRYYHGDNLGSTRLVTDSSAAALAANEYTPYGSSFLTTVESSNWGFAMLGDDTSIGMFFAPFRYYSTGTSRWATRDPVPYFAATNKFGYAHNNPVSFSDASGLWPLDIVAGGLFSFMDERARGCGFGSAVLAGFISAGVAAAPLHWGVFSGTAGGALTSWLRGGDSNAIADAAIAGGIANGLLGSAGDLVESAGYIAAASGNWAVGTAGVALGAIIGGAGASIATSLTDSLSPRGKYTGNCLIE